MAADSTRPEGLLPFALAERWRHVALPRWVAECCGLPQTSTVSDLAIARTPSEGTARAAVEFYVSELVRARSNEISAVRVFPPQCVSCVELTEGIAWPSRVRTALRRAGLIDQPEELATLTYGQLLRLKGLGMKSLIDFGLQAERLTEHEAGIDSTPSGPPYGQSIDQATLGSLRRLAAADWADLIFGSDPRFSDLVPNNGESLASLAETLIATFDPVASSNATQLPLPYAIPVDLNDLSRLSVWVRDIETRVPQVEGRKLEDLLSHYLEQCSGLRGRRRDAILARLGWSGKVPSTLEEAGHLLGVTRERIRQIERKTRQKFPLTPVYVPALTRALQLLAEAAPIEVDKAAVLLKSREISNSPFSPESAIAAANDLGIDSPVQVASAKGVHLVTRAANTTHVSAIQVVARKRAGASGVVSAHDVAADVSRKSKVECSVEDVIRTLEASPRFRNLKGSWFWATDLPAGRNRLVNICGNMLSVTSPISITRLRDGVKREYTFRNLSGSGRFDLRVPPADVLRAFLHDHPDYVVDDDDRVRPIRPLDYRQQLGQSDQILVDVLRSNPSGVLDRATIIRECVERGVNVQTVNVDLTYSCLVEHVDVNIWTLRGADVNPAAVEALRQANALRPREKRVRDFGWTADGNLWIAAVVPPITQPFVFGCPPGSRPYVAGQRFSALMRDGTPCGAVGVTEDGTVYGFSTFQQLSGCDPGDIVVVEFNLGDRNATLVLGNEELLDRYGAE